MLKKLLVITTLLSFLVYGCGTEEETEKEKKKKTEQEQADEFLKGGYKPSSGQKW